MPLEFLRVIWLRKWTAIGVFVAVCLIAVVGSLVWPKTYTGVASIIFDFKAQDTLTGGYVPVSPAAQSYLATQVEIVESPKVALKVVDDLKLLQNRTLRERFTEATSEEDLRAQVAEVIGRGLTVKPSREATILALNYKSPDPQFAAALANAFADAYIQATIDLRNEPAKQAALWFDEQNKTLRVNLEAAQAKLSEYHQKHGLTATEEKMDVESQRLNELSAQLSAAQSATYEAMSRQAQAAATASGGRGNESSPEVVSNPLVQNLKVEIARQEAHLSELAARFGVNHPQYQRAKAERDELRGRLHHEIRNVTSSLGNATETARKREAEVREAVAVQKSRVLKFKKEHDEAGVLQREVENAQKVYEAAIMRLQQTSLDSRSNAVNAAILARAYPPHEPTNPKLVRNTLIGGFLGVILGVVVAFLRETVDKRIRSPRELSVLLDLPVLAVIPAKGAKRRPPRLGGPPFGGWRRLLPLKGERVEPAAT